MNATTKSNNDIIGSTMANLNSTLDNICRPIIAEINGVTFRTDILSNKEDAIKRLNRMLAWMPAKVWAAIKDTGIEVLIPDSVVGAQDHGNVRWTENSEQVIVTLDPLVFAASALDHPFNASAHMSAFIRMSEARSHHGEQTDPEVEVRLVSTLYASYLRAEGVKINVDKFVEKSVRKFQRSQERVNRALKLVDLLKVIVK